MADIDFLWNIAQHRQIESLDRLASGASEMARRTAEDFIEVRSSLERLSLTCRAMWELLAQQTTVTEDDLLAKVHEIDLRDGRGDGRTQCAATTCPRCSRKNNARRARCLYCGCELGTDSAFNRI